MNVRKVMDRALARRLGDYQTTRNHVAKALFLRAKLRGRVSRRRQAVARLHYEARCAVRDGHDIEAQRLLEEKALHREEIARLEGELERLENLVADLKNQLRALLLEAERLEHDQLLNDVIHLAVPPRTRDDRALREVQRSIEDRLLQRQFEAEFGSWPTAE